MTDQTIPDNTAMLKAEALLMKQPGYSVSRRGDVGVDFDLDIKIDDIINPADMRAKIAEVLANAGFQGYSLKEVYGFQASKKPWRTDTFGSVELEFWGEFRQDKHAAQVQKLNAKILNGTKIKPLSTKEVRS